MATIVPSPIQGDRAASEKAGPSADDVIPNDAQMDTRLLFRDVTRHQYRLFWIFIVSLRIGCAAFLYITTRLYLFMTNPEMSYYATIITPAGGPQLKQFGAAFAVLAVFHGVDIVTMVVSSIYCRELVFEWPEDGMTKLDSVQERITSLVINPLFRSPRNDSSTEPRLLRASRQTLNFVCKRLFCVVRAGIGHVKSVWYHLFHYSGVLGVESNYFHWRFFFRELAEVICQSVQVFSASRLVPSQWINRVFVGVVVGNCVSTPTIQYCCHRFRIQRQLRVSLKSKTR